MSDFESYCENLDTHERLATLDLKAEDLLFFTEHNLSYYDDHGFDITDIQFKLGKIYRKTFSEVLDSRSEDMILNENGNKDTDIGKLMREIHRLSVRVNSFDSLDLDSPGQALESVINKIIIHNGFDESLELNGKNVTPSEGCLEILRSTSSQAQKTILEKSSRPGSLLKKLEEPLMTTRLWDHQRDALMEWIDKNFAGYVDMATATGKTVLGIATIASLYGELHPEDQNQKTKELKGSNKKIMIVAHDNLVLEQWGREFDEHLQIPRKFTGLSEDKELSDINLDWGDIHFVTANKLRNMTSDGLEKISKYDLLVLDEIHKYKEIVGHISSLIERNTIKIIALSGSIDVDKSTRKEVRDHLNRHLPLLGKYTLEEAKEDGIIPNFSWHIVYNPPQFKCEEIEHLRNTTSKCKEMYQKIQKNENIKDFHGYEDARDFGHTIEGKNLKQDFDIYREYLRSINARRTRLWNLTPSFESMADIIEKEAKNKKCLALVSSNDDIRNLKNVLNKETDIDNENIWTVGIEGKEAYQQKNVIDEFDESDRPGVIIGTGKRLGVGVDFLNLEAVVNATSGYKVNKSLVQRMGRMLRDPKGEKEKPVFYNMVPILGDENTRITSMDGRRLLEGAAQYLGLADMTKCKPGSDFGFSIVSNSLKPELIKLENEGREYIEKLISKGSYREPTIIGKDSENKKSSITYLKKDILKSDIKENESIILEKWSKKEVREKSEKEKKKKKPKKKRKKKEDVEKELDSSSFKEKIKGVFGKVKRKLRKK